MINYWLKEVKHEAVIGGNYLISTSPVLDWVGSGLRSWRLKTLSVLFLSIGVAFALNGLWPIISYKFFLKQKIMKYSQMLVVSDISNNNQSFLTSTKTDVQAIEVEKRSDFNLVNWFPQGMPQLPSKNYSVNEYAISIPKLKIDKAKVIIGGQDLAKGIIHYKGTSVPGELGQPVLFGHSNLPQFYSPTSYKTIFTKLSDLEIGDRIQVEYDGVDYDFQVVSLRIVKPDDFTVLEQYYNYRGLRLITCVPPGTTWERLVVDARLIE